MKIHRNIEILSLYMDGELDKKLKDVVESHLQDCSECREILARMQKTKGLMEETPPVNAPAYLEKEILDSLPSKKVPSLSPFKKFSVGAVTFTVLLLASLLLFNRYKTEDIQIAMSPEQIKELEKKIGHRRDMYEDGMDASKPSFGTMKEKGETVPSSEIQAEPDASEKDRRFEDRSLLKEGGLVDEKKGADKIKECEEVTSEKQEESLKVGTEDFKRKADSEKPTGGRIYGRAATPTEGIGLSTVEKAPVSVIIKNEGDWQKIWHVQNTAQNLSLPLPEVDFKDKMVVALLSRIKDKEYIVVNTIEEKDKIIVEYKEIPLQKSAPPPYQLNVVSQKPVVTLQKVE
jgi:hypothetical protein